MDNTVNVEEISLELDELVVEELETRLEMACARLVGDCSSAN